MTAAAVTIRPAEPADVPGILALVHELARYEKEPEAVEATEADFRGALFPEGSAPTTFAHVAEVEGGIVGVAIWFLTFSTWTGRNGIWLEDLVVTESARGTGLGRELLETLAALCVEHGYRRLEWSVLDWNEPAIEFYRSRGAVPMDEWTTWRLAFPAVASGS
jgi:GNAT superfamily N-acetyltransferase